MNRSVPAARAAMPENLPLPIEAPRAAWPMLIEHAAATLAGGEVGDTKTLARELRAIAKALREDVQPRAHVQGDGSFGVVGDRNKITVIHLHVERYAELLDALRECVEAEQPMSQYHATEHAREVLRRAGVAA